jgi:hypothetical protein
MRRIGFYVFGLALYLLCAVGLHRAQKRVDAERRMAHADLGYVFLPDPQIVSVFAMGFDQTLASMLWVRSVLTYVDLVEMGRPEDVLWFKTMLETVNALDVQWRTPYFYGGGMLRLMGDIEASDAEFQAGMDALPQDPYFPFALGMNAYLYRNDHRTAAKYLERAAALPLAPRWYRTAAAGFLDRSGQRRAALRYLKGQIELATTDRERFILSGKYRVLLHHTLVDDLETRRTTAEARTGIPLTRVDALGALPPDPFGGTWIVAVDGHIRSDVYDRVVSNRHKLDERGMLTRTWLGPDQ